MNYRSFLLLTFASLIFCVDSLFAQTIKVVDETTLQPVVNVYIYNNDRNRMVSTNVEGEANIAKFTKADTLNFQHPSYQSLSLTYQEVQERANEVKLAEKSVLMDEIYVSASKREQDATEIPQRIAQIAEEQILFNNPQTSADLLQSSGKVFVQKSQMGGGSPMIRGFAANSVLLAVDGVRMNNAIFRSGNLQNVISIDANALENTEVLFGPGSIIYGSDALGGVMNFQTKEPALSFDGNESIVNINTMARYSSANNERTAHADASFGYEKWGMLTSVTYSNFDDMRSGGNFYDKFPNFGKRNEYVVRESGRDTVRTNDDETLQRPSGYEQLNLMQKFRYKPNNVWDASYGFHYATTTDIPRYDRLIERENGDTGQFVNAEWYYGPQIWMMNTMNVQYFAESDMFDKITGVFSQQWFQESRNDRDFQGTQLRNREENVNVYTANLDFDKLFGDNNELYYGIEGIYNYVGSEAHVENIETGSLSPEDTRYPDQGSDYAQFAAYTKYERDLASNFTAIGGVRYSHVMLNAQFDRDRFDQFNEISFNTGALNGSLGFTYRPTEELQLNVNGSSGFRAPNVDDAAKVFDSEPGTVIVPNENIEPEKSYNIDFSVIKDFGNAARFELNTYYTWLKDAMVRRDFGDEFGQDSIMYDGTLSKVEAVVNAGEAYIYGASIEFKTELWSGFSFDSELTFTEGEDITNNEPLRHVAPLFGRGAITYKSDKIRIEAFTEFNAKKDISDFSPSERSKTHLYTPEGSPSWVTLNLKTSYQFSQEVQLNAGIENILDKHYRPYSSGISAAGRNITVTVRTRF
jgi:hemoglobin/transferrin/lactoferrin receptor protein